MDLKNPNRKKTAKIESHDELLLRLSHNSEEVDRLLEEFKKLLEVK